MEAEISHPLLLCQLREHFGSDIPPAIDEFLLSVDRAYHESDATRERMGRSVSLSLEKLLAVSGGSRGGPVPNLQEEIRLATELLSQSMLAELEAQVAGRAGVGRSHAPVPTVLCVVEAGLMRLIERILSPRGYRVLEAVTGSAARDLMTAYSGRVDLLILDDNLPDIGWAPLYSDLRRCLAGGTVLLCNSSRRAEPGGPIPLRKPFSIEELTDAVSQGRAGASRR